MAEMRDIIDKLIEGTQQNRVPWKTAASDRTFIAAFGNLSVLISSESIGIHTITKLSVLDEMGNEIDHATHDTSKHNSRDPRDSYGLWLLYQAAKRCAAGADRKLDELISRIDAAPPISTS